MLRKLIGSKKGKTSEEPAIPWVLEPGLDVAHSQERPVSGYVPVSVFGGGAYPFYSLPARFFYDLAYMNDILRTSIRALIQETFRKGVRVDRQWLFKCAKCGRTYHAPPADGKCSVCGSEEFVEPNEANRVYLESLISDVNTNNESLIDVLSAIDWDLNVLDNAYLVVRKRYYYDKDGNLLGAEPIEVIRGDPINFRLVMDKQGRFGRDEAGNILMFCPEHRELVVPVSPADYDGANGVVKCQKCGKQMLIASYRWDTAGGSKSLYFAEGEVLHVKKFTYGMGYGYPPIASIWIKIMVLMRQDYFILMGYQLMRSPRGLLVFRGASPQQISQAWQMLMEKARQNPWMLYPIAVPQGVEFEFVDLSFRMEEVDFGEYRNELRRSITAIYGVMPIFLGETAGMGRDVMQILVTNRAVEMEQRLFNEKVLPWLCRQLGVEDYCFVLPPSELRDESTFIGIQRDRLDMIRMLQELGYEVEVEVNDRGEIVYRIAGVKQKPYTPNLMGMPSMPATEPTTKPKKRRKRSKIEGLSGAPIAGEEMPRTVGQQRLEGEPAVPRDAYG